MKGGDLSVHPTGTVDAHVGNRVRIRRLSLGISQQDLARQLGLTFQQVQKYEKGANRIGASRLYELAALLNVPVDFFFEGLADSTVDRDNSDELIAAFKATSPRFGAREFVELNRAFQRIANPDLRKTLLRLIDLISRS
ncbi:MAG: helix-turn-helix domain-containing protein [Alphaproteobacteria bacterium]